MPSAVIDGVSAPASALDAATEAQLRADIEQVLAKYRLQAPDVRVEISATAPATHTATHTAALSDENLPPASQPAVEEDSTAKDAAPTPTNTAGAAATTHEGTAGTPPTLNNLHDELNPASLIPPELQVEMERERQRRERSRILKSFTGKSVLLADKKRREEEKLRQGHRASNLLNNHSKGSGSSSFKKPDGEVSAAPTRSPVGPQAAPRTASTQADGATTPATRTGGSRPGSVGGGGARHTAVSLPEDTTGTGEARPSSVRRTRSGATIPVFSILAKEGSSASVGGQASSSHLNNSVSLKDSPCPPAEVVHTPLVGESALSAQPPSILRGGLPAGASLPGALPQLAKPQPRQASLSSSSMATGAEGPRPLSRGSLVQSQLSVSRDNQRRASELAHSSRAPTTNDGDCALPNVRPAACTSATRLSTSGNSTAHAPTPSADVRKPSLRELLAEQEKEERLVAQKQAEHQRLLEGLRLGTAEAGAGGVGSARPSEQPSVSADSPVPAPPQSPPPTSLSHRPSSTAAARSPSARGSIQVCRVTLPTEPKARAEVVEQFCGSAAGQEVVGSKNRYEHLLSTQQQLLESRKREEKQYQAIVEKAVELNEKLKGP